MTLKIYKKHEKWDFRGVSRKFKFLNQYLTLYRFQWHDTMAQITEHRLLPRGDGFRYLVMANGWLQAEKWPKMGTPQNQMREILS